MSANENMQPLVCHPFYHRQLLRARMRSKAYWGVSGGWQGDVKTQDVLHRFSHAVKWYVLIVPSGISWVRVRMLRYASTRCGTRDIALTDMDGEAT